MKTKDVVIIAVAVFAVYTLTKQTQGKPEVYRTPSASDMVQGIKATVFRKAGLGQY